MCLQPKVESVVVPVHSGSPAASPRARACQQPQRNAAQCIDGVGDQGSMKQQVEGVKGLVVEGSTPMPVCDCGAEDALPREGKPP